MDRQVRINNRLMIWLMGVLTLMVGLVVSVSGQSQPRIHIGILQYVEHDSLDQVRKGFIDELDQAGFVDDENIQIDYLNASADTANLATMSQKMTKNNDYLFAIGTQAAQSLAGVQTTKPIYFSAVSDPVGAGLVESLNKPNALITGTTDAGPIDQQIELLERIYPNAQKIGLIYNSGEANAVSEMKRAKQLLKQDYDIIEKTITSTNDVHSVMNSLLKESDVIFIVADNTIASSMSLVGNLATEAGVGIIGGSADMVLENGLATYGLNYYDLGAQTARMFIRQLNEGMNPSDMPVESAEKLEIIANEKNAKKLGLNQADFGMK